MADLLEFLPLFTETTDTIRARLDADVNAGLSTDDPRWIDTREGTFYWDITQVVVLELARLWDALATDVPASAFLVFAWGDYLDYHAQMFGLERKEAVPAAGEVTFTGDPGTVIATGTVVSTQVVSEDATELEFATTATGTIGAGILAPTGLGATPSAGGSLDGATYYYRVTALNAFGETDGSVEVSAVSPANGKVALDWSDRTDATGYRVYRSTQSGEAGQRIYEGTTSAFTDSGTVTPGVIGPPDENTTAGVTLTAEALTPGTESNVSALAVDSIDTPNPNLNGVTNHSAMVGGTEVESDEELRDRILLEFEGSGQGTVSDYKRWARTIAGVGRVTVAPVWDGPGTVLVVVMTSDGGPVSTEVVDAVQDYLDPLLGGAEGQAPPGITVTVETPATVDISVAATIVFKDGFTLTGASGTIEQQSIIDKALGDYVGNLDVGEDVIFEHVKAQLFRAEGVYNVSGVTVNGGTSDVSITLDPPQIATYVAPAVIS